ncbi:hypothetical protein MMC25_006928 [Agyrium rufum]|nr:hypothetical protein [Agyrium rufum]
MSERKTNIRRAQAPKEASDTPPNKQNKTQIDPSKKALQNTPTQPISEQWRLTQEEIAREVEKFKKVAPPLKLQALLIEGDIWNDFTKQNKSHAQGFVGGAVQLAIKAACSGGPPTDLIETGLDLIKEKFVEKSASRVVNTGIRNMKREDDDPDTVLVKKLLMSMLVFGILIATGGALLTTGIGAAAGAVFSRNMYISKTEMHREADKLSRYRQAQVFLQYRTEIEKNISGQFLGWEPEWKLQDQLMATVDENMDDEELEKAAALVEPGSKPLPTFRQSLDNREEGDNTREEGDSISSTGAEVRQDHREAVQVKEGFDKGV